MSMATERDAIATAMTAIGLHGFVYRPALVREGDCWPLWAGASRGEGPLWAGLTHVWTVTIALSADERAASDWIDDHLDLIMDALTPVMAVDSFEPAALPTEAGDLLALTITGRTE